MTQIMCALWRLRLWREDRGQDFVEYALLAGLVAVASGLFIPQVSESMVTIFSRMASKLSQAAS